MVKPTDLALYMFISYLENGNDLYQRDGRGSIVERQGRNDTIQDVHAEREHHRGAHRIAKHANTLVEQPAAAAFTTATPRARYAKAKVNPIS